MMDFIDETLIILATCNKKKKAFIKFLYSLGCDREMLNDYQKYIASKKGKVPYNWITFKKYIFNGYSCMN